MKNFCITYQRKTKRPGTGFATLPSEWFKALTKEDVPEMLYRKLGLTKEEFKKENEIVEITEVP